MPPVAFLHQRGFVEARPTPPGKIQQGAAERAFGDFVASPAREHFPGRWSVTHGCCASRRAAGTLRDMTESLLYYGDNLDHLRRHTKDLSLSNATRARAPDQTSSNSLVLRTPTMTLGRAATATTSRRGKGITISPLKRTLLFERIGCSNRRGGGP